MNLPHWLSLSGPEIAQLSIRPDAQHSAWTWRDVAEAAADEAVHPYVRPYAAWVRDRRSIAAGASMYAMTGSWLCDTVGFAGG